MLKKLKNKLKKANNSGSSFVLVIVSTTFLAILVSALIMGVYLAYKMRLYRLNSLNNFYSVEKAMDEIYAGVGASVNEHLYSAYSETAELVIYYDGSTYTSMDETTANTLFKRLFMSGIYEDDTFSNINTVISTLESYITVEGVKLETDDMRIVLTDSNGNTVVSKSSGSNLSGFTGSGSFDYENIETLTLKNVTVKRTIEISSSESTTPGIYVQSITTDLELTKPEYNVAFDISSSSSDSLYSYALLADMGLEVDGTTSETAVKVTGNIYTASDYYNKDYNADSETKVTNSYSKYTRLATTNSSIYSGIFVNGQYAKLDLLSDVVICSGSLAAFNGAAITLGTTSATAVSELWTDNIIIGGSTAGGSISMKANAYVYDDTELNATESSFTMYQGSRYFGYSYSADDSRSLYYLQDYYNAGALLSKNFTLRSHFSDSSIVVNGKNSVLNISSLSSLYVAGKSYIEFSKATASTISTSTTASASDYDLQTGDEYVYSTIKDYATGFSIDVKSNQLIFLTSWTTTSETSTTDGYTTIKLEVPDTVINNPDLKDLYSSFLIEKDSYVMSVVQTSISGTPYYYLLITESEDATSSDDDDEDSTSPLTAEEFAIKYYDLLSNSIESTSDYLYNVKNYEDFEVTLLLPSESNTYTSAAATNQDTSGLYIQEKVATTAVVETALENASTNKVFTKLLGNLGTTKNKEVLASLKSDSASIFTTEDVAEQTSNFLEYMYINMKHHLSVTNTTDEKDAELTAWDIVGRTATTTSTAYNYSITPLNYFIDFNYVLTNCATEALEADSEGMHIYVYAGDAEVKVEKGIIICGGDVTFASNITSFSGMIICGGKVICDHSVSITANATSVAAALEACATSKGEETSTAKNLIVNKVFKNFETEDTDSETSTGGVSISDISYSDILAFQNWKKNVT